MTNARISMLTGIRCQAACVAVLMTALTAAQARAQDTVELRRWFDSGQYQRVVDATAPPADPAALYVAALSAQKLGGDRAGQYLDALVELPEADAWHFVGLSASQLRGGDAEGAQQSARRATAANDGLPEAHYQLGLVLAQRQQAAQAAGEFDRAAALDPSFAYAHYYAGLMHYRANRPDLMAARFETFLKLAPDAPERAEVTQIMRTVRGR